MLYFTLSYYSFLKYEYKVEDVLFKELKRNFIEKFVTNLFSVRNMLPDSIITPIRKLKLMVYTAL